METKTETKNIYLAEPRGFCAGVRRAIAIVEQALHDFGAPVYVRHEIVHNKHVIESLKAKGVIFIDGFSEIDDRSRPVIFSAHGVPLSVEAEAKRLRLKTIDATCPLVSKVHRQIQKLQRLNMEIIVIGKPNHVEIMGTIGQVKDKSRIHVINSLAEAEQLGLDPKSDIGFVTQTTLSVDDTRDIVSYLKQKFPTIETMRKDDICFATTNRQKAVKEITKQAELVIVIGSKNSSNSKQLREVALKGNTKEAFLIDDAAELDWKAVGRYSSIGITAGASAPEYLVEDLLYQLRAHYDNINIIECKVENEKVDFKL